MAVIFGTRSKYAVLDDKGIKIYKAKPRSLEAEVSCPGQKCIASLTNDIILSVGDSYTVWEIDWSDKTLQKLPLSPKAPKPVYSNKIVGAYHYSISEDGKKIVVPKDNSILVVWDVEREEFVEIKTGYGTSNTYPFSTWATLPGNRVVVGNSGGRGMDAPTLRIFSMLDGTKLLEVATRHRINGLDRTPFLILPLPKCQIYVCYSYGASGDTDAHLVDYEKGSVTEFLIGNNDAIQGAVLVSERQLIGGGEAGLVSVDLFEKTITPFDGNFSNDGEDTVFEMMEDGMLLCCSSSVLYFITEKD